WVRKEGGRRPAAGRGPRGARPAGGGQPPRGGGERAHPGAGPSPPIAAPSEVDHRGPRLLNLAELERTRDALAARVMRVHELASAQTATQATARARLQAMYADPQTHKGETISNRELGLPGCTTYTVRPRFLSRWWRVKVSSGCP